ncbi:hypothetical protein GIS00_11075 [Nakamurella sp. YIM 132087]|uniref:Uncharacterized protein n=1 Tax=Nakamurella alba TaxID=2665158 RepID=A0A7K1FK56_9ACTN|nr:hypothetical protein [Nakamurella alba]MTD14488.1 hypothetical protein [Nakamurella alba]
MYIAGTDRCRVEVAEPLPLVVALYLREVADLDPPRARGIPRLEPAFDSWPVWARNPPSDWDPPLVLRYAAGIDLVDRDRASEEWDRWWSRLLLTLPTPDQAFRPPAFRAFRSLPALRLLLQKYHDEAARWAEAVTQDPRVQGAHAAPRSGLASMISDLVGSGRAHDFRLRLTVIPVASKHAWVLRPDHVLITRLLIADTDNVLDWLRPRVRSLAGV